jgi:hypothetical protein
MMLFGPTWGDRTDDTTERNVSSYRSGDKAGDAVGSGLLIGGGEEREDVDRGSAATWVLIGGGSGELR